MSTLAFQFGQHVNHVLQKQADGPHEVFTPGEIGPRAIPYGLIGLGLGGLVGGVHGAIDPGKEDIYDRKGVVKGQKLRSPVMGALRGAGAGSLVGGIYGGLGGTLADFFSGPKSVEIAPGVIIREDAARQADQRLQETGDAVRQKLDSVRKSWGWE